MQLTYTNAENTSIQAVLDDGEQLGNVSGPATVFVPCDPANAEYQAIEASGEPIAPYVPPPVPSPQPVTLPAHPEAPMDAATKGYVDTEVAKLRAQLLPASEA
jgi:hypothetical protein